MDEFKRRPEPKKIRLLPLVDRSSEYDTFSLEGDTLYNPNDNNIEQTDENNRKDNSQSISELES